VVGELEETNGATVSAGTTGQNTSTVSAIKAEAAYDYTDYGETAQLIADSTFENEICYTGGIYDESTGLYYLNARYFDPENARFLTQDTYRGKGSYVAKIANVM